MASIISIVPIVLLFVLMLGFKMAGHKSALLTLVVTVLLALFAASPQGMIAPEHAGDSILALTGWAVVEGLLKAVFPILIIILMAIYSYNILVESKQIEVIKKQFTSITDDKGLLVLLLVWGFGGLLEGMAGFGTAVAIPAAILIGLGFKPMFSALVSLARTVPTNNPYWADWFYTWFLGMVDQWRGYTHRQYGNSVAPLLISKQGFNKSTFCRRLLPPELQWGYSDNLILSEKRQVYQAMAQFMLINLDEFNQISPQVQQGFLKNLIQLPTLKYKPPYGSHVMEFPRLASFIATSNMNDILTDPSGNRRFIGIELTGPIDVSVRPNHQQLFAQALVALGNGEKCYFDAEQVKLIMQSNCQFEVVQPIDQYFRLYFEPADDEKEGEYMTAAEIFDFLKKQIGSSLKVNSLMGFGRKLANMTQLNHKRFADGMKYLVKKR